ncbi:hypothetical protein BD779DRAFT_914341 [Infundibulicybe gibba]|nr:hypothetical protein BD779DRAFT_914341 [Infundibulicybe gibba]
MSSAPDTVSLNCVVFGHGPDQVFIVDVALNKTVSALKKLVVEKTEDPIPAVNVHLFQLSLETSRTRSYMPCPTTAYKPTTDCARFSHHPQMVIIFILSSSILMLPKRQSLVP